MTTVINLIGGPGCGKSTLAAELYAVMKQKGMNVEMVREVAKEWAWEGKKIGPFEQISILGEQIKKESSLFNKVKYVVTDSPVLLGSFYFAHNHKEMFMTRMVQDYYKFCKKNNVKFFNYILPRTKKYAQEGRFENEAAAKKIDEDLLFYTNALCFSDREFDKKMNNKKMITQILKDLK